jgi:hypothetical protein
MARTGMMDDIALMEIGIVRAADRLGDITPHVMSLLNERHIEAPTRFAEFREQGHKSAIEGEMVEQTLHCVMQWLEDPMEVESILWGTVPHHVETLKLPPSLFGGLFEAVIDTITAEIPDDAFQELELWSRLREQLLGLVARFSRSARL